MPNQESLPRTTVMETLAVISDVVLPTLAKGVIIRRPPVVALAQRLKLDLRAVRRLQKLRDKYGEGPVVMRLPFRSQAIILTPAHVHHVLENSPEPFATAESAKKAALSHFEPKMALVSHGMERAARREVNEQVLESHQRVHQLAQTFIPIVKEEARALLDAAEQRGGDLDWDAFILAWYRIVRRVVLGDAARDDHALTDILAELRGAGNWVVKPKNKARRQEFLERLDAHLSRAEPGSLASIMARIPKSETAAPLQQVPQWLFAFDPAGMTTFRALWLLSTHPEQAEHARTETRNEGDPDLPYLRACILESLRLWPTSPLILRQSTRETVWESGVMPPQTSILIFAPFFHRDDEKLPYANRFDPQLWLSERTSEDWPLIPFSGGPGICPGRNLVLLLTSHMLATLLHGRDVQVPANQALSGDQPLPATLDNYSLQFVLSENRSPTG